MPELLIRLLITIGLVLFGVALFRLVSKFILARARTASQNKNFGFSAQSPTILYFTTPDCVTCKAFQRPQLRRLNALLGRDMPVVEVNATEQPALASQWGVLSVPTTFILDHTGTPRHVNYGAVAAEKLAEQVRRILEPS